MGGKLRTLVSVLALAFLALVNHRLLLTQSMLKDKDVTLSHFRLMLDNLLA